MEGVCPRWKAPDQRPGMALELSIYPPVGAAADGVKATQAEGTASYPCSAGLRAQCLNGTEFD